MTKRIFGSIFFVSVIALVLLSAGIVLLLYNYSYTMFKTEIRNEASLLSACLNESGSDFLLDTEKSSVRITLISEDGKVLYDNKADESSLENHSGREEFILAQKNGTGESYRYSETNAELTYYYAVRLDDNAVIRVSGTHYTVYSLFIKAIPPIAAVVAAALILSLILASRLAKSIVKPINEIDLEHPDEFTAYDELAPLLNKIKLLGKQIDDQILELKRKKQEFTAITENMSEGFLIVDRNTDVISSNAAASRLFGVERVENNESVLKVNRSTEFTNTVESAIAGKRSEYIMHLNGRVYQILANPVFDDNGKTLAAVLVILDVTDREKADKLRREFTANVSHELKTPLTSISGFAEIMMNGVAKKEDMQHFAGNIYNEAQRMIALIGDIIKLSRLDENDTPVEKEKINLLAAVESVVERLGSQADKMNVKLEIKGEELYIDGVTQIIDEMIYNIVENAVKYNIPGGRVDISLRKVNDGICLSVSDTGIGIPYADQRRVFERFYRVDKSHSKAIGGTGLGLSIVKHGALFHNARIKLYSVPEVGTTITIIF